MAAARGSRGGNQRQWLAAALKRRQRSAAYQKLSSSRRLIVKNIAANVSINNVTLLSRWEDARSGSEAAWRKRGIKAWRHISAYNGANRHGNGMAYARLREA